VPVKCAKFLTVWLIFFVLSREALLSVSTNFFEEVDLGAEGVKVKIKQQQ